MNAVYEIITNRIIQLMDEGEIPWNRPYNSNASDFAKNLITNKEYRGINRWLLFGRYPSPYYLTSKQAKKLGGRVKREEYFNNYQIVVFWDIKDRVPTEDNASKTSAILRFYKVWNVEQCEGLKHERLVSKDNGNHELVKPTNIVKGMPNKPIIKNDSASVAYYRPSDDSVHIGTVKQFKTAEAYHSTLFHELVHSTGHASRLDRELNPSTEKDKYSREELIAEFGSAFLCEMAGISKPTIKNSAAYIQHWQKFLVEDVMAVVTCASKAEKACDYILNKS